MKKIFINFVCMLLLVQAAFAGNIEVLPTMQSKTNAQDRVWVGTFQLVWNDFMDKYVHDTVKFIGGTPSSVLELNQQEIKANDIDENCWYKYSGKIASSTKKNIENAIKKKFNETSDIIKQLDFSPNPNRFIIYVMLKKDFKFINEFDKLGKSDFRDAKADFFGISNKSDKKLQNGVTVLFYNSSSDFAVKLQTEGKDEVFLYRTPSTNQFNYIYSDMMKKENLYRGNKYFVNKDELKIPNLKFYEEKSFSELEGKRIKGTRLEIEKAIETVKFEMNNAGVKLKSEAAMTFRTTAINPKYTEKPRCFYFDDTFVVFLKEKNSSKPYFALRVHDITKFQK